MFKKIPQNFLLLFLFTPLVLDLHFYQPYTSIKYFYFAALILLLLPFLFVYLNQKPVLWKNGLVQVVTIFFIVTTALCFFSLDFERSFFGDWQRFDGLVFFLLYFVFFLILLIFLDTKEFWLKFLRTHSLVVVTTLVWAYGQRFSWSVFADADASRVYALIGNANFLAHYLLLSFFLVLFLVYFDQKFKFFYLALAILIIPVILFTQSRGAFVAMVIVLVLLFGVYIVKIWRTSQKKALMTAFIFLFCILVASQFLSQRFTKYSWQDATIETRLVAWNAAYQGFLEKPILGWGRNNFQLIFNKYLDTKIYKGQGTPMWFDKAHNQYLDYLAEGGLLGLGFYALFLIWPFIYFKKIQQKYGMRSSCLLFGGLLANLIFLVFNFDTIASYPLYFIHLALIYFLSSEHKNSTEDLQKKSVILFCLGLCLSFLLAYFIFWPQVKGNMLLKEVYLSQDKNFTLSEWSEKVSKVDRLAPNYSTDLSLTMAQSLTELNWPLEEQILGLRTLLYYSQQSSQKHLLDAKAHYLTANTALRLGTLSSDEAYLLQAIDFYTNILSRLTQDLRPDVVYNLASAYYQLSLLHPEQKEDFKTKAIFALEQNIQAFPNSEEAKNKRNLLLELFAQ